MSVIFGLLILVGVLAVILVVLGNFLPTAWTLEKAVLVQANPEDIFPFINALDNWQEWTVWNVENDLEISSEGPDSGVGATQYWKGQLNAKLFITKSEENKMLEYQMEMEGGKFTVKSIIALDNSIPEHTQVAWRLTFIVDKNINARFRYQGYFLRNYFESTMKESLIGLQTLFGAGEDDDPYEN